MKSPTLGPARPTAARPAAARPRSETGMSLIELVVTMSLVVAVLGMVLPQLAGVFRSVGGQQTRSQSQDLAQVAVAQIERDLRSGRLLTDPGPVDGVAGMDVILATEAFGAPSCVEYRISGGVFQRRSRDLGVGVPWPTAFSQIIDRITNGATSPAIPAFRRDLASATLDVSLVVDRTGTPSGTASAAVRIDTSITGRDAVYDDTGTQAAACA